MYAILKDRAVPIKQCPKCGQTPFDPFMRGMVYSPWRKLLRLPYWSLICWGCKEIVGHEDASLMYDEELDRKI